MSWIKNRNIFFSSFHALEYVHPTSLPPFRGDSRRWKTGSREKYRNFYTADVWCLFTGMDSMHLAEMSCSRVLPSTCIRHKFVCILYAFFLNFYQQQQFTDHFYFRSQILLWRRIHKSILYTVRKTFLYYPVYEIQLRP